MDVPTQGSQLAASPVLQPTSVRVRKKFFYVIMGILLGAVLISGIVWYFVKQANAATITGVINYSALKPDPTDKGEVLIKYRKYGTNEAYKAVFASALANKSPWVWKDAVSGQPYEMTAELVIDKSVVTTSEPIIVTAPAVNQELDLRVTWRNLPQDVVSEQQTYIKGTVIINGYIPPGSEMRVLAKATDANETQIVASSKSLTNANNWEWKGVRPLKSYILHAVLISNGLQIGRSEAVPAEGGDSEIAVRINSTAIKPSILTPTLTPTPTATITPPPPTPTSSIVITSEPQATPTPSPTVTPMPTPTPRPTTEKISGKVTINGPKDKETSLLLLWRKPGQGDYQVITRINYPSHDGQAWEWNAPVGGQYEITTALQVNEQNTSTSQSQIVAAPAENIDFTLNTGVIVDTPGDKPSLEACNQVGNQWDATIKYPVVQKAGNYWFQVGTNPGLSDTYDSKIRAEGNDTQKQVTVRIDNNRTYYTRYAYSLCINCSNNTNFSNFADSFSFSCGGNGSVYRGYKCNTSYFACEQTTDPNAPYAFNNEGLVSCQKACQPPTPTPTNIPTQIPTPTNAAIVPLPQPITP